MNRSSLAACLSCLLLTASPVWAVESLAKGTDWSVGGAASAVRSHDRVTLWDAGAFSAGMAASGQGALAISFVVDRASIVSLCGPFQTAWRNETAIWRLF